MPAGHRPYFVALGAFWLWTLLSATWSWDQDASLLALFSMTALVGLQVVLTGVLSELWAPALKAYAGSTVVVSAVLCFQPASRAFGGQATFEGIDPNVTAFQLSVGLAALAYLVLTSSGLKWLGWSVGSTVAVAAILHTGSRSGVSAAVLVAVVTLLLAVFGQGSSVKALPVVIAGAGIFIWSVSSGFAASRVSGTLNDILVGSDAGRSSIWAEYMQHAQDWAVFGIGLGADAHYLSAVTGHFANVHSLFGKAWVELGILGAVLFACVVGYAVVAAWHSPARPFLVLAAGPLVVFASTLGFLRTDAFWFVMALALARSQPLAVSPRREKRHP